jgi:pimeloyl-ACP methyl ester carboxylesterase
MAAPIGKWIVCINGYTQGDRWRTGVGRIYREILAGCSNGDTSLALRSWRDDVAAIATNVLEWGTDKPELIIVGYSYGGWSAVRLCRELEARGIGVASLVLIDAVWRPWQRFASWRSLLDGWTIVVPANVKHVLTWRQKVSRPRGHLVVAADDTKTHIDSITLNVGHAYADDQPEVRRAALQIACPNSPQ